MPTIYTFGYLGSSPIDLDAFIDATSAVVIDTRLVAYSRNPNWVYGVLTKRFGPDQYQHIKAFGNVNYKNNGPIELLNVEEGLRIGLPILAERSVILMCACRDAASCHRSMVAERLHAASGASVVHLPARFGEWEQ